MTASNEVQTTTLVTGDWLDGSGSRLHSTNRSTSTVISVPVGTGAQYCTCTSTGAKKDPKVAMMPLPVIIG